jgi:DtxR family manganese transport transcriptional regulator
MGLYRKQVRVPKSPESQPFRRTRRDHASEIAEDYVETIADVIAELGSCRVRDLSERFGVTHVTVVRTVQRLERDGLITTEPYKPIELTPKGTRLADECKTRHEIVLQFLIALGVPESIAAIDTEGIEHHVSPETLKQFEAYIRKAKRS